MKEIIPDKIEWYSGYKRKDRPTAFFINNEKYIIKKVIESKLIEDITTCARFYIFLVETDKGKYKIKAYEDIENFNEKIDIF